METQEVICRKCERKFVPNFAFDFYPDAGEETGLCENCIISELLGKNNSQKDPVPISETHIHSVCKTNQGETTCKFLAMASSGMVCAKHSILEGNILSRAGTMLAQGDNCSGPPNFETL